MPHSNASLALMGLCVCASAVLSTARAADADSNISVVDRSADAAATDGGAAIAATSSAATSPSASTGASSTGGALSEIVVVATRLNAERSEIETQTGASVTT